MQGVLRRHVCRVSGHPSVCPLELLTTCKLLPSSFVNRRMSFTRGVKRTSESKDKETFEKIAQEIGIREVSDWYRIPRIELARCEGGQRLLTHYGNMENLLRAMHPDFEWITKRFETRAPPKFWDDVNNQRAKLEEIGSLLGIKELSGWYNVSRNEVLQHGGDPLFKRYHTLPNILANLYPAHPWDYAHFLEVQKMKPAGYWADIGNQRKLLDEVGQRLGVKQLSDWYNIKRSQVTKSGGVTLFYYYSSLDEALQAVYPNYIPKDQNGQKRNPFLPSSIQPNEKERKRHKFWKSVDNQRNFLNKIGQDMGVKELSDWYSILRRQVVLRGGKSLFNFYSSLPEALQTIYPHFPWEPAKFIEESKYTPPGYWQDTKNLIQTLTGIEDKMGIKEPGDWYNVSLVDLQQYGFPSGVSRKKLLKLLEEKYPQHSWDQLLLLKGKHAQRTRLENSVRTLFPKEEIVTDASSEANLVNPSTKEYLELDIYVPSLKLAFVYQGKHHFNSSDRFPSLVEVNQQNDALKQKLAKENGIILIAVPCWWDGTVDSLVATIKQKRPDLLQELDREAKPIPETAPPNYFDKHPIIEDIGVATTAMLLTQTNKDPTNWWMFEKYDGLRGFWNPLKKAFYSRNGNKFLFPAKVVDSMPDDIFLDGEIWFGRDNYLETTKLSNRVNPETVDWTKFKYMIFDAPKVSGTYQERYNHIVNHLKGKLVDHAYLAIAEKETCKNADHMDQFLQDVIDKGGEGIILRDPTAPLQPGRSAGFLKHKKFRDGEAKVIGKAGPSEFECELPNGVRFIATAETNEFLRRANPEAGDIVTFKHHGYLLMAKKPKRPSIYRLRTDLRWEDVVNNWEERKVMPRAVTLRKRKKRNYPKNHWKEAKNRRQFFIEFAKKAGFNPLEVENWLYVTLAEIYDLQGRGPLSRFNNILRLALEDAFPELNWEVLENKSKWRSIEACKEYFDNFAKQRGLDPNESKTWLAMDLDSMLQDEKNAQLVSMCQGSLKKALTLCYPEQQLFFN